MSNDKIHCETHGEQQGICLCRHLLSGEKQGFNCTFDEDAPYELRPAAWCDQCEGLYQQEGDCTDDFLAFVDGKVVCACCYDEIRERNWLQDDDLLHDLICESFAYLDEKQKAFLDKYKLREHNRWDWDQERCKLLFSHDGVPQVEADIHFSGSYSEKSETWLWAWANDSLLEPIKKASQDIKTLGENLGLKQLEAAMWSATDVDGWEMTSVMAKHMNAIGAYRTHCDSGYTYMVVTAARWLN